MMLKQLLSTDKIFEKMFRIIKTDYNVQKPMKCIDFHGNGEHFVGFPCQNFIKENPSSRHAYPWVGTPRYATGATTSRQMEARDVRIVPVAPVRNACPD